MIPFRDTDKIRIDFLSANGAPPLALEAQIENLNPIEWGRANQQPLEQILHQYGSVLFRNFQFSGTHEFELFLKTVAGNLIEYQYASTPRTQIHGFLYSSTEYPADQIIPLHNEESYARSWPMRLGFYCVNPATCGGETPIADSRQVYKNIPKSIRERFAKKKVMYVRNYGTNLDLSWESVFRTTDKSAVEAYCRQAGINFEWYGQNALRTIQVCQAEAIHPHTQEPVWFNQAHLFHISNLPIDIQEAMLECIAERDLPRQAYYGDGTSLESDVLEEIRRVYREHTILFPWQKHDVLLIDNMLTAHGRTAFTGSRKILVGMTTLYSLAAEL